MPVNPDLSSSILRFGVPIYVCLRYLMAEKNGGYAVADSLSGQLIHDVEVVAVN